MIIGDLHFRPHARTGFSGTFCQRTESFRAAWHGLPVIAAAPQRPLLFSLDPGFHIVEEDHSFRQMTHTIMDPLVRRGNGSCLIEPAYIICIRSSILHSLIHGFHRVVQHLIWRKIMTSGTLERGKSCQPGVAAVEAAAESLPARQIDDTPQMRNIFK